MRELERQFRNEMSKMPAERHGIKQIDGFILELYYDSRWGYNLMVYRKAFDNENHWRKWKTVGSTGFKALGPESQFDFISDKNDVTNLLENHTK